MKKYLLLAFTLVALSSISCLKGTDACTSKSPASEAAQIQNYANMNGIAATQHTTGLFYEVVTQGSGPTPGPSSIVYVNYTGKLLDGTVFDSHTGTPLALNLGSLIQGWQVGLPLIQKGGVIKLIIPSAMAYGCQGAGSIPANSIVYFEVQLVDVQ